MGKKRILVLCTGNMCRSPMGHGFAENSGWEAYSAGVNPAPHTNPNAIIVMKEIGIDISHYTPSHVDEFKDMDFDLVLTVCDNAKERCPIFTGKCKKIVHHSFPDPWYAKGNSEEVLNVYRKTRDEIQKYMNKLLNE
jgi:arsenate reductase (thioredoxin)